MCGKRCREFLTKLKQKIYAKAVLKTAAGCGEGLKVNFPSFVSRNTFLGNHVNFNGMKIVGNGKVTIGDWFHSGQECLMITSFHNYDAGTAIPYDGTTIDKDIEIGDCVWLGDRVIVLGGAKIGEGAIVQAGSVVVGEIPSFSIAGGHPAVPFKTRDVEHYMRLKEQGCFH